MHFQVILKSVIDLNSNNDELYELLREGQLTLNVIEMTFVVIVFISVLCVYNYYTGTELGLRAMPITFSNIRTVCKTQE